MRYVLQNIFIPSKHYECPDYIMRQHYVHCSDEMIFSRIPPFQSKMNLELFLIHASHGSTTHGPYSSCAAIVQVATILVKQGLPAHSSSAYMICDFHGRILIKVDALHHLIRNDHSATKRKLNFKKYILK
jgi:hypothetical protein